MATASTSAHLPLAINSSALIKDSLTDSLMDSLDGGILFSALFFWILGASLQAMLTFAGVFNSRRSLP